MTTLRLRTRAARLAAVAAWLLAGAGPAARAACTLTQDDFDGSGRVDVRVVGDSLPQRIEIDDRQTSYRVRVDCNNDGDFTDAVDRDTGLVAGNVETYDLQGKGTDAITFVNGGPWSGASKNLLVTFGPVRAGATNSLDVQVSGAQGGSSLVVDLLGSRGPEDLYLRYSGTTSDFSFVIRGDLAPETIPVRVSLGPLLQSVVTVDLALGPGNNSVEITPNSNNVEGSTVVLNLEGSNGSAQVDRLY